jgi:hypothetical protein
MKKLVGATMLQLVVSGRRFCRITRNAAHLSHATVHTQHGNDMRSWLTMEDELAPGCRLSGSSPVQPLAHGHV